MNLANVQRMFKTPEVIGRKPAKMSTEKLKNMLARRKKILSILEAGQMCSVDIHKELNGAYETTQKDIRELEEQGEVRTFNVLMLVGFSDKGYERKSHVKVVKLA